MLYEIPEEIRNTTSIIYFKIFIMEAFEEISSINLHF